MRSVFMQLSEIDATVAQAKALLCDAQTCVEANLYDGGSVDEFVVRYHAGNIQVLLGVIEGKLSSAATELKTLDAMLHSPGGETGGAA